MKLNRNYIWVTFLLAWFLLATTYNIFPDINKVSYLLIPLSLLHILIWKKVYNLNYISGYIFLVFMSTFNILWQNPINTLREIALYLSYCLPLATVIINDEIIGKINFFISLIISFCVINLGFILLLTGSFNINLIESASTLEHAMIAPISGILSVFLFRQKNYVPFIICFVICFFAFKRVVLVATLAALLITIIPDKFKGFLSSSKNILILSIIFLLIFRMFALGYFDEYIENYFGISANYLTQGRQRILDDLFFYNSNEAIQSFILGGGSGFSSWFVEHIAYTSVPLKNIHSDLIKVFVDYGVFGGAIFLLLQFKPLENNNEILPYFIFLLICMLSDNFIVYAPVMFIFYFVVIIDAKK